MTTAAVSPMTDVFAAVLRGTPIRWDSLGVTQEEFLDCCAEEDLTGLMHQALSRTHPSDWPAALADALASRARQETATELLRHRALIEALVALATAGVHPLLLKGTALAYQEYPNPALRPRSDTDLLIHRDDLDTVRRTLGALGYREPAYCDGELLFCQFEMQKADEFGVGLALDFHWKISTQTLFADLMTYDEMASDATPIPALGRGARGPGLLHALLLACVHPVMHHRNIERLIWVFDVHLLASKLGPDDWGRFVQLARSKGVATICRHQLALAGTILGTRIPEAAVAALAAPGAPEPTAAYLDSGRQWKDELVANVRGLRGWRDRLRLLREVGFPRAEYMLQSYGVTDRLLSRAVLPLLYVHRGLRGIVKVLRGRK